MWRQLRGAFQVDRVFAIPMIASMEGYASLKQFSTLEDALSALDDEDEYHGTNTVRCYLEPTGYNSLYDLPQEGDLALILGNTEHGNMQDAYLNETYQIKSPKATDLYGINAAAIALAIRYGQ